MFAIKYHYLLCRCPDIHQEVPNLDQLVETVETKVKSIQLSVTIIEGFHVTSYQANFASHHTHDRHVGFPSHGIGKHNKMFCYFLFSSYHIIKLQLSDKNISTHKHSMVIRPFYKARAPVRLRWPVTQESTKSLKALLVLHAKAFELTKLSIMQVIILK